MVLFIQCLILLAIVFQKMESFLHFRLSKNCSLALHFRSCKKKQHVVLPASLDLVNNM